MTTPTYRPVPSVPGLEVTADAEFRYKGKAKKVIYPYTVTGRRATVRCMIMWDGKNHYWQAAKLVAEAWKHGYEQTDRITYRDGNCHNIKADNLMLTDEKGYDEYMRRNSVMRADTLEERKQKLQLVIDEAGMTLHYMKTLDIELIKHYFMNNPHGRDSDNQKVVGRSVRWNGEDHLSCCVNDGVLLGQIVDGIYIARTFITYDMCSGLQQKEFEAKRGEILTDEEMYEQAKKHYL